MTSSTPSPPLQRPTTLAQKHGLGMPDSHLPLSSSMRTWLPNNSALPPEGSQPMVDLARAAVPECVVECTDDRQLGECERNIRPRIIN